MNKKVKKFELGISSWTFPWAVGAATGPQPKRKMTPLQLLEKAKKLGVSVVQIADNMPLEDLNSHQLSNVKSFAKENNIYIEAGTKDVDPEHLSRLLDIADYLESGVLRTLPALFGSKISMTELEENIRKILSLLEEKDITIVLENTEAFLVQEYADLMDRINHPKLKMCVDAANAIGRFEGPHYVVDTLAKYCANYHFKDIDSIRSSSLMGFSIIGAVSGKGKIPLDYALNKLTELGNYTSVILEQWPPLLDSIDATIANEQQMAELSISYLQSVLNC